MSEAPVPPSTTFGGPLPKIVDAVILQALENDRAQRYADMHSFARSLHSARNRDEAEIASESAILDRSAREVPWAAIAVAVVVAGAAIAWAMNS